MGHFAGYKRVSVLIWVILQAGKATLIFDTNFGTLVVRLKSRTAVTYCVTAVLVEC
jgi:hypothetical protein